MLSTFKGQLKLKGMMVRAISFIFILEEWAYLVLAENLFKIKLPWRSECHQSTMSFLCYEMHAETMLKTCQMGFCI
jgi:hypothetical protein